MLAERLEVPRVLGLDLLERGLLVDLLRAFFKRGADLTPGAADRSNVYGSNPRSSAISSCGVCSLGGGSSCW